jgi:FOG: EAL domain
MRNDAASTASQLHGKLKAERDRFLALSFCWADVLFELNSDREILYATGAIQTLVGRKPNDLVGTPLEALVVEAERETLGDLLTIAQKRGRVDSATLRINSASGTELRFSVSGYQLDDRNSHFFVALRFLDHAPTGRQPKNGHDEKTGLRTAQSFVDAVTRHLTAGDGWRQGNLLILSLSNFDALRQRLPRAAEDELLQSIGTRLRATAVDGDSAARLADDRFGVILESGDDGAATIERIRHVSQRLDPSHIGVDIQTSTVPVDARRIASDDLARFVAVTIRRFCSQDCVVGAPLALAEDISQVVQQTMRAVGRMRQIIEKSDFMVAFQPIVDIRNGNIHHFEALARFPAATGMKTPFENISFAESTGLIIEFDLAMVKRIIEWLQARINEDPDTRVAVNLSGQSVNSAAFLDSLDTILRANQDLRSRLMFEITESCALADLDTANAFIQNLREQGFVACLDDLGAGAANISYLSMLQVDVVKIDGHAMHNARKSQLGRAFLTALVGLCGDLGVSTVAEMVEDTEMLQFVRDCGVDYVQGFLFSRPSPDIQVFHNAIPRHLFGPQKKSGR